MAKKIPIIKLNNGYTSYYPLTVGESVVVTHDIEVKNNVGGYKVGDVVEAVTTFDEIVETLLAGDGKDFEVIVDNITIRKNINDELEVDTEAIFSDKFCEEVTATSGTIINSISQSAGKIYVDTRDLTEDDIPALGTDKVTGLSERLSDLEQPLTVEDLPNITIDKVTGLDDKLNEIIPVDRLPSNIPIDKVSGLDERLENPSIKDWGYWTLNESTETCHRIFWDGSQWRYKDDNGAIVTFDNGLPAVTDPEAYQLEYGGEVFVRSKDVDTKAISQIELENTLTAKDSTQYNSNSFPDSVVGRITSLEEKVGDTTISDEVQKLKGSIKSVNHTSPRNGEDSILIDTLYSHSDGKAWISSDIELVADYNRGVYVNLGLFDTHAIAYDNINKKWLSVGLEKISDSTDSWFRIFTAGEDPYDWQQLGDDLRISFAINTDATVFKNRIFMPGNYSTDNIDTINIVSINGLSQHAFNKTITGIGSCHTKFSCDGNDKLFVFGYGAHYITYDESADELEFNDLDDRMYSSLFEKNYCIHKQEWTGMTSDGQTTWIISGDVGCMVSTDQMQTWQVIADTRYPGKLKYLGFKYYNNYTENHNCFIGVTPDFKIYISKYGDEWSPASDYSHLGTVANVVFGDKYTNYLLVLTTDGKLYRIMVDNMKTISCIYDSLCQQIIYSNGLFIVSRNNLLTDESVNNLQYSKNGFDWIPIKCVGVPSATIIRTISIANGLIRISGNRGGGPYSATFNNKQIATVDDIDNLHSVTSHEISTALDSIKFSSGDKATLLNTNDIVKVLKSVLMKLGMKEEAITMASTVLNS